MGTGAQRPLSASCQNSCHTQVTGFAFAPEPSRLPQPGGFWSGKGPGQAEPQWPPQSALHPRARNARPQIDSIDLERLKRQRDNSHKASLSNVAEFMALGRCREGLFGEGAACFSPQFENGQLLFQIQLSRNSPKRVKWWHLSPRLCLQPAGTKSVIPTMPE